MKINIDERFLEEDIKLLGLSERTYNALTQHGRYNRTIGYVKKLCEEDSLYIIKGIGPMGQEEIKIALINFTNTHNNSDIADNNIFEQPLEFLFDVSDKNLIKLKNNGIFNIEDLLNLSENQLGEIIDKPTILKSLIKQRDDLLNQINQNNLQKRKKKTQTKKIVIKSKLDNNDFDINEIPEKYRKTYAIGAGVVAEQELQNLKVGLIERILNKTKVVADKPAFPEVKISKQSINKISDKQLLKVIAEDISVIESLDKGFVTKYRKDLIKIILENSTLDVDKRLELVELINNTQINTL